MFLFISVSYYIGGRKLASALGAVIGRTKEMSGKSHRMGGIYVSSRKISAHAALVCLVMIMCK